MYILYTYYMRARISVVWISNFYLEHFFVTFVYFFNFNIV